MLSLANIQLVKQTKEESLFNISHRLKKLQCSETKDDDSVFCCLALCVIEHSLFPVIAPLQ